MRMAFFSPNGIRNFTFEHIFGIVEVMEQMYGKYRKDGK